MRSADGDRIRRAIDDAERGTTGRIGVRIVSGRSGDALEDARRQFARARLHEHVHRNAIIFFIAPAARRFAVFGDEAIHDRAGDAFWEYVIAQMQPHFGRGDITGGLVHGIALAGEKLRELFPDAVIV